MDSTFGTWYLFFFFFKQKTAYEMRISDWSSDVCSSDLGSADAILQSMNLLTDEKPDIVMVIGPDHVYRMDFGQMLEAHISSGARATVAGIRQPIPLANPFGVIDVDPKDNVRIRDSLEKPQTQTGLSDAPHTVPASMGTYNFNADPHTENKE